MLYKAENFHRQFSTHLKEHNKVECFDKRARPTKKVAMKLTSPLLNISSHYHHFKLTPLNRILKVARENKSNHNCINMSSSPSVFMYSISVNAFQATTAQ